MTTEREMREADRLLRPDFESGPRLKGLDEMAPGSAQWEHLERPVSNIKRRRRNWPAVVLVSATALAVAAWVLV